MPFYAYAQAILPDTIKPPSEPAVAATVMTAAAKNTFYHSVNAQPLPENVADIPPF